MSSLTWDPCISHRDSAALNFINQYFSNENRRTLLICGAGFDPRSTNVARAITSAAGSRIVAQIIREDRPRPDSALLRTADNHQQILQTLAPEHEVLNVPIFSTDEKTVVGGRQLVGALRTFSTEGFSDIVVDMSALSMGVSFPLVRFLHQKSKDSKIFPNVHLLVSTSTEVDSAIQAQLTDKHQLVAGFGEELGLAEGNRKPQLWLPQLSKKARPALELIFRAFKFTETCPIVPFPSRNNRAVEELVDTFRTHITEQWGVDDRDFLYAAEDEPLDLYRTILRVDSLRGNTYAIEGGSLTVLSPLGTKSMALGALLAALERDLAVVYVEVQRYTMVHQPAVQSYGLVHLWLSGQAYQRPSQ